MASGILSSKSLITGKNHKLTPVLRRLITSPNLAIEFVDCIFIKAPEHSARAACSELQDIGKRKGSNTAPITN